MVGRGPQPPIQADKSASMRLEEPLKKAGIRAGALFARKTMFMNMEKKRNLTKSEHRRWCAGGSRKTLRFCRGIRGNLASIPCMPRASATAPLEAPPKTAERGKKTCVLGGFLSTAELLTAPTRNPAPTHAYMHTLSCSPALPLISRE